ncbi:MAG TPA: NUDIX hydrolase [Candidatus Limnocylindria bacterium]|nr:NUDIX hydrolase [Candidatus Limnocylindria bacterium]
MLKDWKIVSSKPVGDFRIFKIRSDEKVSPRTGQHCGFFIIESVDWVNVIAVTPQDELVMVEQYRHGSNTVELEIPGGIMDPGETDPAATGVRELREETGYEGAEARPLGWVYANPAIMNNRSHFVVVEQCVHKYGCQFDHSEDLITRLVPWKEIPAKVREGSIRHPLVLAALYHYELSRRGT